LQGIFSILLSKSPEMKRHIPNLITLLNLCAGFLAILFVLSGQYKAALVTMLCAAMFDFLDGTAARLLKAQSPLGVQLDSLADMISFALLPAMMVFSLLDPGLLFQEKPDLASWNFVHFLSMVLVLLIPSMAALRLARFNIQEENSYFFGLPTPAFAMFWTGIYFDYSSNGSLFGQDPGTWFLLALVALTALLMVAPIPMLTLKFKHLKWKGNGMRYFLLLCSILILIFLGIPGLSMIIVIYILLSFLNMLFVGR
jgi:CDP-diacylglycerol--serine O-phosphatidyltransferase